MRHLQYGLQSTNHTWKLKLPATYERLIDGLNKADKQSDKPNNFINNRPTDIWLTKDGSKSTNHFLQSSQLMRSRLDWQTTDNIVTSSTNEVNQQRHNKELKHRRSWATDGNWKSNISLLTWLVAIKSIMASHQTPKHEFSRFSSLWLGAVKQSNIRRTFNFRLKSVTQERLPLRLSKRQS